MPTECRNAERIFMTTVGGRLPGKQPEPGPVVRAGRPCPASWVPAGSHARTARGPPRLDPGLGLETVSLTEVSDGRVNPDEPLPERVRVCRRVGHGQAGDTMR